MIEATLVDKVTRKPLSHVRGGRLDSLLAYNTDKVEVVFDVLELEPPVDLEMENLRDRRNKEIDAAAWAWRADSPLTQPNQIAWLNWAKAMHSVLKNGPVLPANWPAKPDYDFV